jgi:hypothetical protein
MSTQANRKEQTAMNITSAKANVQTISAIALDLIKFCHQVDTQILTPAVLRAWAKAKPHVKYAVVELAGLIAFCLLNAPRWGRETRTFVESLSTHAAVGLNDLNCTLKKPAIMQRWFYSELKTLCQVTGAIIAHVQRKMDGSIPTSEQAF